jgi:hypothetical protein
LRELEVILLIKSFSEDARINGNLLTEEVKLHLKNQIMKYLLKKRLKLRNLLNNPNGIKITGVCLRINMMM